MSNDIDASLNKLSQDFKAVVADAEALLRATASESGDRASEARERILDTLEGAKQRLAEVEASLARRARAAARAADTFVHEHPWETAGIAAGIGVLIGMLISRR